MEILCMTDLKEFTKTYTTQLQEVPDYCVYEFKNKLQTLEKVICILC